jgi:phosphoglycerate dehydrogenase-like enzyme
MKPTVTLLEPIHENAQKILEEVTKVESMFYVEGEFYHYKEPRDIVFNKLKPLKTNCVVACPCTSVEHITAPKIIHLDDEWKANKGREVTSTAEHTWSLILQLAKMKRMQLKNKTIGIIGGLGRIGICISDYADAFGMEHIWYDKRGTQIYTLDYLLKESDIITLHIPLQCNEGFIGMKEFAMMKDGALLVNTSRQGIVDMDALYKVLEKDKLGGYADDFLGENSVPYHLFSKKNIIQTPHIAGNTVESRMMTDIYIANKIKQYIEGGQ